MKFATAFVVNIFSLNLLYSQVYYLLLMSLRCIGITAQLLNARPENVEREAEVVAQAGRLGAVTVATNMAGE